MYMVVSNIPHQFHSKHLRNYFAFFIKKNAFEFFHYKHRSVESFLSHFNDIRFILAEKCKNSQENNSNSNVDINNKQSEEGKKTGINIPDVSNETSSENSITTKGHSSSGRPLNSTLSYIQHYLSTLNTSSPIDKVEEGLELVDTIIKDSEENLPSSSTNNSDKLGNVSLAKENTSNIKNDESFVKENTSNNENNESLVKENTSYNENEVSSNILSEGISRLSDIVNIKKKDLPSTHPFSKMTEKKRSREEILKEREQRKLEREASRFCCFIKVKEEYVELFKKLYHKKFWIGLDGKIYPIRCLIFDIKPLIQIQEVLSEDPEVEYISRKLFMERSGRIINLKNIEEMFEFKVCSTWPHGNVGTSNEYFKILLGQCKLPSHLISKLGLPLGPNRMKKGYSQVHLDYGTTIQPGGLPEKSTVIFTGKGDLIPGYFDVKFNKSLQKKSPLSKPNIELVAEEEEEGAEVEEWERFEAFHNDVTKQERTKLPLFESEIEQVWEKGGPGLVFYTDEQFWRVQEGGNEERDPDEWDVDMNPYYGEVGDADATNSLSMTEMEQLKNGIMSCSVFCLDVMDCTCKQNNIESKGFNPRKRRAPNRFKTKQKGNPHQLKVGKGNQFLHKNFRKVKVLNGITEDPENIGTFEEHTKGIGRRLLESQGWKAGQGLGKKNSGTPIPVGNDGQHPSDKRGLGFNEKVNKRPIGPRKGFQLSETKRKLIDTTSEKQLNASTASNLPQNINLQPSVKLIDPIHLPNQSPSYPILFKKSEDLPSS